MKITRCNGEGLGSCTRCDAEGRWNRVWMSMLYRVDGFTGCYCDDCVRDIKDGERGVKVHETDELVKQLRYLLEGRYYRKAGVLAADLGVSRQSLYAWGRGTTIPKKENRGRINDLYMEVKEEDEKED